MSAGDEVTTDDDAEDEYNDIINESTVSSEVLSTV